MRIHFNCSSRPSPKAPPRQHIRDPPILTALQGAANCIALFTVVIGVASEKMLLVQVHQCSKRKACRGIATKLSAVAWPSVELQKSVLRVLYRCTARQLHMTEHRDSDFAVSSAHKWFVVWRWQAQRATFYLCCLHICPFLASLGFGFVGTSTKKPAKPGPAAELFPLLLACAACGWLLCVAHVA